MHITLENLDLMNRWLYWTRPELFTIKKPCECIVFINGVCKDCGKQLPPREESPANQEA